MLLKQRVLHALTRLGDRDTIRVAVKELTRLIATMRPEHTPSSSDAFATRPPPRPRRSREGYAPVPARPVHRNARRFPINANASVFQRPTYRLTWRTSFPARTISHAAGGPSSAGYHRRDARRVFLPHLPRVVSALARRFKDPDSVVTDACVDVVGSLAERVALFRPGIHRVVLSGPEAIGPHFVRPILDVIHETNSRAAQDTASRSLARVFHRCGATTSRPLGCQLVPGRRTGVSRAQTRPYARREDVLRQTGAVAAPPSRAVCRRRGGCPMAPQLPAVLGVRVPRRASMSTTKTTKTRRWRRRRKRKGETGGLLGALKSPDWPTRRGAAVEGRQLLTASAPRSMATRWQTKPLVDAVEARVRECGFDKVRPARDAVHVAMSLVQALRRYGEERLPAHDVAAWRRFARGGVGGYVASLGEEAAPPPARRARASLNHEPGLASRKARRREDVFDASAGAKSADRRESIAAFREARIAAHGNKDVVVMVPNRPPPALDGAPLPPPPPPRDDSHRASRPFEEDAAPRSPPSTVEAARGFACRRRGNTYEVASSEGAVAERWRRVSAPSRRK